MPLLRRKALLAIFAVIDIAVHERGRPVSANDLALRHHLPARALEPVLRALVRERILEGFRGPGGGYKLAREDDQITVHEIVRAAQKDEDDPGVTSGSEILSEIVVRRLRGPEDAFYKVLAEITVQQLARAATQRWTALSQSTEKTSGTHQASGINAV